MSDSPHHGPSLLHYQNFRTNNGGNKFGNGKKTPFLDNGVHLFCLRCDYVLEAGRTRGVVKSGIVVGDDKRLQLRITWADRVVINIFTSQTVMKVDNKYGLRP